MGLHLGLQPAALQAAVTLPQPRVVLGQLENTKCAQPTSEGTPSLSSCWGGTFQ